DGRLQSRTYEGQDGKTVYVTEVVADSVQFLEPKNASQGGGQGSSGFQPNQNYNQNQNQQQNYNQGNQNQNYPFSNEGEPVDISDDDLAFLSVTEIHRFIKK